MGFRRRSPALLPKRERRSCGARSARPVPARVGEPGAATSYLRVLAQIDVRYALPMVVAPTLVLHARRDRVISIEHARYLAERMPSATLVELDSADHLIWFSDAVDVMTDEIQDFLIAAVPNRDVRRVLATVVFIDELGPRPRRPRPGAEPRRSQLIERFRGRTVRHDGSSILATFDGPARAIRCASEIGPARRVIRPVPPGRRPHRRVRRNQRGPRRRGDRRRPRHRRRGPTR